MALAVGLKPWLKHADFSKEWTTRSNFRICIIVCLFPSLNLTLGLTIDPAFYPASLLDCDEALPVLRSPILPSNNPQTTTSTRSACAAVTTFHKLPSHRITYILMNSRITDLLRLYRERQNCCYTKCERKSKKEKKCVRTSISFDSVASNFNRKAKKKA